MKKHIVCLLFFVAATGIAQHEINTYRYLIMPEKFSFLKQKDLYQLNSLAKIHFEKLGFIVFYDTETLPDSLVNYNCNKLFCDVESIGNIITTKLVITLKDCKNKVVVQSKEGKSKEKDYKISYSQAFRDAFTTFRELGYQYQTQPTQVPNELPVSASASTNASALFYAQPISNGYQLVDSSPKVVYKLLATSNASCFIAYRGEQQGVLIQKNQLWYFEYYENGILNSQLVSVKF